MNKDTKKLVKITMDQYYGISDTRKKNGTLYIYLRFRHGSIKESVSLPGDFYTLSKVAQQKEYRIAKDVLDKKLGISKEDKKDMRKSSLLSLIDKYLEDYYENVVRFNVNKRSDFDTKQKITRMQIERHAFSMRTIEELVSNDVHTKAFFQEAREGFTSRIDGKFIKPCAKSTINKQVWLILGALKFARLDKKWITADDLEVIQYQIKKYKEVGEYSIQDKTRRLSKYEFTMLHKEILERKDTGETFTDLFANEIDKRRVEPDMKEYLLYLLSLERRYIYDKEETLLNKKKFYESIDHDKAVLLYKEIDDTVKETLENGFMTHQPEFHYPVIRYYRDDTGHLTTKVPAPAPKYADVYRINRKTTSQKYAPYYLYEGSLAPLFLLFNVNTGFRFNENRSLQVKNIKLRTFDVTPEEQLSAYYICLESQIKDVIERDEKGNILYHEDGTAKHVSIETGLKTIKSFREIPLNDTAVFILKKIQEITGTIIFNHDGTISDVHAERYIFVNYNKPNMESQKYLGREGAFYGNFQTPFTYAKLKKTDLSKDNSILFKSIHVENKEKSYAYYMEQLRQLQFRMEEGEEFNLGKQVYVNCLPHLVSNSGANKALKIALNNMRVADAKNISVHSLRKTTSSIMSEQGQSKIDIQHIIGHSENSEVTENVYILSHFLPALRAVQSLDKTLNDFTEQKDH